jgi:hypothetical protein
MPLTPVVTALIALSAIAAAPISLHFEGNEGTLEPFFVVLPLAVLAAGAGVFVALRARAHGLWLLNALAGVTGIFFWIALLTYEGGEPAAKPPVREADQWRGSGGTGRFPQLLPRSLQLPMFLRVQLAAAEHPDAQWDRDDADDHHRPDVAPHRPDARTVEDRSPLAA